MLKRVTSLLLCLLLAFSVVLLASCGGDGNGEGGGSGADGDDSGFLNEAKNWNGETVKILGYKGEFSYSSCQIDIEEPSNEPVENAFYNRNALIEEKYGLNIDVVVPGQDEDPITMIRNDMLSGGSTYQAVVNAITYVAPLASEGLFHDFNDLGDEVANSYIHMNEAWWDQTLVEDVKINNKIYFAAGDALVEDDEATWAIYFNKDIIEEYGLENPYELVNTDEWTLDKMYEMLQKVELTNGSTKSYDPAVGDVWGMVVQSYDFYLFMQGCEQPMVDNTGSVPVLRVENDENVATFQKITEFYYDPVNVGVADYHGRWNEGVYDQEKEIFANGNALFMPGSISYVGLKVMQDADINYGILPMPKRSDLQEDYSTGINAYHCAVICIPFTNNGAKLQATAYALEAMAYYGKQMVTPEYYDRTLTLKRFEDQESGEMLDLIFTNRTYDLGSIFNFNNGNVYGGTLYFYTNLLGQKSDQIIAEFTSLKPTFQAGIDELIEQCEANENKNNANAAE